MRARGSPDDIGDVGRHPDAFDPLRVAYAVPDVPAPVEGLEHEGLRLPAQTCERRGRHGQVDDRRTVVGGNTAAAQPSRWYSSARETGRPAQGDPGTSAEAPAHAGRASVLDEDPLHGEARLDLSPGVHGSRDQQLVETGPSRADQPPFALDHRPRAGDHHVADVEADPAGRRPLVGEHGVEQAPASKRRRGRHLDLVAGDGVAGESCAVQQEHAESLPREQHRGRRTGDPRTHHDGVVPAGGGHRPGHAERGDASDPTGTRVTRCRPAPPCSRNARRYAVGEMWRS